MSVTADGEGVVSHAGTELLKTRLFQLVRLPRQQVAVLFEG
jgi:hypothetical protein